MCFPWFLSNFSAYKSHLIFLLELAFVRVSLLHYDNILKVLLTPKTLQLYKTKGERGSVGWQKLNDLLIVI